MNDVQKFVNGILKNHNMHKRYIAVLTALSMVVSIVVTSILVMPADSKAGSLICEKTEHIHDESCKKLVCGLDEGVYDVVTTEAVSQAIGQFVQLAQLEGETVGDAETEVSVEVTESIIEAIEETVDSEGTSESAEENSEDTNEETIPQVTEGVQHVHTDECYMYVCGFEEHTHSEDCYESVEVDPTPDEVDSYMINQNAFDVFNVFGRPMHLLYEDVSVTSEHSTENNPDSTMQVNPGAILGVATHFHVLAEEASFQSHVHGNVATNHLIQCGAFGVYLNKLAGKSSVNYIKKFDQYAPLDNAYQTKLVLGSEYSVTQEANRYKITDKSGNQYYIPVSNFPEGGSLETDIEVNENYINVTKELDKFADMSRAIAAKESKETVYIDDASKMGTENKVYIIDNGSENYILDFTNITDKYIYYTLDLTKNDRCNDPNGQPLINFSTCSKVLEIKGITEDKFLFLTVDVGDIETNSNVAFNKSWKVYRADDQSQVYGTGEVPLDDGSCRVIYNIVNSTTSNGVKEYTPFGEKNGMPTDSKIILGEQKNGTFLVPRGYVNCAGNTNGTIIAYKYVATGESHRADIQFEDEEVDDVDCPTTSENVNSSEDEGGDNTTQEEKKISITVNKVWSDGNENHQNDSVEIRLYKAYESKLDITDNSLIGNKLTLVTGTNQITLNQSNNWTAKFEGLPVKDVINDQTDGQTEKLIYYYIKEVDKNGYTTTYSANGLNSVDRTVNVRNTKKMSVTVEKQWYNNSGEVITQNIPEITFRLYKSTIKVDTNIPTEDSRTLVGEYTLNSSTPRYTIENLESEEDGQTLYYYVEEVNPSSDYNVTYENNTYNVNSSGNMVIKNTQKASGTISITVTKNWNASDYSGVVDYVSPVRQYNIPVKVTLQKSTDLTNWINVDSAEFTTSYTFSDLPKKDKENDKDLYYRVVEGFVYGYKAEYNYNNYNNGNNCITASWVGDKQTATVGITNNLINKNLTINKSWYNNMSDGVNSIVVEVYRKLAGRDADIAGDEVEDISNSQPQEPENPGGSNGGGSQGGNSNLGSVLVANDEIETYNDDKISGWKYVIPNFCKGYTIKKVTFIYSTTGSSSYYGNGKIWITQGDFSWEASNEKQVVSGASNVIELEMNCSLDSEAEEDYVLYYANYNTGCKLDEIKITFKENIEGLATVSNNSVQSFFRGSLWLFASVNTNPDVLSISGLNSDLSDMTFSYDDLNGTYPAYKTTISESDDKTKQYYGKTLTSIKLSCQIDNNLSCEAAVLLVKNNTAVEWIHTTVSSSSENMFTLKNGGCYIETGNTYDIYVFKYTETTSSDFKINDAACNFSTGNTTTDGEDEYTTGNTTHNFTTNGTLSSFYNISGELSTNKDTQYYNGLTLTQCLKINSKASINFLVSENHTGKLILVFGNSKGESFYIDNTLYTVDDDGVLEIDNLSVGSHTISQNSGNEPDLFYMTYSETVVENQKKDEVSFVNNVLTVIPANAKGENNKYYQNNEHYFENAWGYQIPSEHRGKTITNIKVTFESNVNGAEICILTNKNQGVTQAYWDENYTNNNSSSSSSFEWSNISYKIPTTYSNYSLYVIEVGDINSNGNNSSNLQEYTITRLEITFASGNKLNESKTYPFEVTDNGNGPHYNNSQALYRGTEFKNYLDKTFTKFEVYYKDSSSVNYDDWFGIHKVSTSWGEQPVNGSGGSWDRFEPIENPTYNNNIVTYNYGEIAVVNFYENDFFRIKVNNPAVVEKIVFHFTDTSEFTLWNSGYNSNGILEISKDITLGHSTSQTDEYQDKLFNKSEIQGYLNKYLTEIHMYFKNPETISEGKDQPTGVNMFIVDSTNFFGNYLHTGISTEGNVVKYKYSGSDTLNKEGIPDDFYRISTSRNTEIQKIVFNFNDGSTYTLINSSYLTTTSLERNITLNNHAIKADTLEWTDDNHESFGFESDTHYSSYSGKIMNAIKIYYRDMLIGFPNYLSDTKIYVSRNKTGADVNGDSWVSSQESYSFDENVATWFYKEEPANYLSQNDFFKIKTSRTEEISKVVICFTDGSTYTMNNTAYIASSKVESSEDDYTYNTGEYVLIAKITLTADGNWSYTFDNLPATDGQGNAYTYHIKETNIYGSEADKYKVLSYTHEDGIVLENDSNNIGVTNARNDDESIIVLPNTGGTGTKGYFIAGIIVMICSVAGYTVIKRRLIR